MRTQDWESVARSCWSNKAITTKTVEHEGRIIEIDIVKPLHGDPEVYYAGILLEVPRYRVTPAELDAITDWRPCGSDGA